MQNPAISADAGLPEKVLGLHATLADREVAHAFGGAIALAYHAEPRATYVTRWLSYFLGDSDPIIDRFQEV